MNIVINIGELNSKGQFNKIRWIVILEWLSGICNNIRTYTKFYRNKIDDFFSNGWSIEEESFPDHSADLRGFRLWGKGVKMWGRLKFLSFDPDNGITHIYFLDDDNYIGELVVEDGENFLILHLTDSQEKELLGIVPNLTENIKICSIWYEFLNEINEGDAWKPLGSESRDIARK